MEALLRPIKRALISVSDKSGVVEFAKELEKIWGKSNKFFTEAVKEYSTMIHERNLKGKTIIREESEESIFSLVPISVVLGVEKKDLKISLNKENIKVYK